MRFSAVEGLVSMRLVLEIALFFAVYATGMSVEANISERHPSVPVLAQLKGAPAIRLTFHAKRAAMTFNGQLTAQATVIPRSSNASAFEFDAILTQVGPEHTEEYMWLDNGAYWSKIQDDKVVQAGCIQEDQLPPLHLVASSISQAQIVHGLVNDNIDCPQDGSLLELSFASELYVVCTTSSHRFSHAKGAFLDVDIEYLSQDDHVPAIQAPQSPNGDILSCPSIRWPSQPLVKDANLATERRRRLSTATQAASCHRESIPLQSSYPKTWGNIENHAPCCSSTTFARFETVTRDWNNPSLQADFCNAALSVSGSSSTTIGKLILVTHSMGNLIAAAAAASGVCHFTSDLTWVTLSGPMTGSQAANLLETECAKNDTQWFSKLAGPALELFGYCPVQPAYASLKYITTVDSSLQQKYAAAQAIRRQFVSRVLCGVSPGGLISVGSVGMQAVAALAPFDTKDNDGLVTFSSCTAGINVDFGTDAETAINYRATLNHLDTSFRNGDGWWSKDKMPSRWFECTL
ncbi:hypothetical protein LEN26_006093 [Aphanomyces euteiches]|nr:hypothetical protein AeMF1_014964 [Aphanomyces euteiches]KAH9136521.1 hypothetical protein LEN26_006093 [Aphanomyces euteiches]KAH9187394.1 hypothetical protein AeNC1_010631 [Aphanomyces euteiches]